MPGRLDRAGEYVECRRTTSVGTNDRRPDAVAPELRHREFVRQVRREGPEASAAERGTHVGTLAVLDQDEADHGQCREHLEGQDRGQEEIHVRFSS